jgi:hypothetical protein
MKVKLNGNDFYEVTSPFGALDNVHSTPHTGLDLAMDIGTQLNSPVDGVITKVVDFGSNNIGKGIYIETEDHHTVIMGHLSDIKTHVGAKVHEGDFIAYSGSTGASTGGHLHLGLKDASGHFTNPQPLVNQSATEVTSNGFLGGMKDSVTGAWDNMTGFWDFLQKWHEVGFWKAMYGKSFFQVITDFFIELGQDIGTFILQNSEVFFVIPSIGFMICTWVAGRNKFTKWIVPLWIGYLFSKFLYYTIGG